MYWKWNETVELFEDCNIATSLEELPWTITIGNFRKEGKGIVFSQSLVFIWDVPSNVCVSLSFSRIRHGMEKRVILAIAGILRMWIECRYYLVIVQYVSKLDTELLRGLVRDLKPKDEQLSKKKFNFQLADEATSFELSGYSHNAVTPVGMRHPVPVQNTLWFQL